MIHKTRHTEIVLTGGPSGGKTSALALIQEKLTEWGYHVFIVPETASMIFSGCIPDIGYLATKQRDTYVAVEGEIFRLQMDFRTRYRALADIFANDKCVIIYDRAEPDVRAFIGEERYAELLSQEGYTHEAIRDSYDAVIHLTSIAVTPDLEYQQLTNPVRKEDRAMAADADGKVLAAWMGSPNLHIIDPNQDFGSKQRAVLAAMSQILGRSKSGVRGHERRYLANASFTPSMVPKTARRYTITQHYLRGSNAREWRVLTQREAHGIAGSATTTYYRGDASRDPLGDNLMIRGRIISRDEYERQLRTDTISSRPPLVKERAAFHSGRGAELEVDQYTNGLVIVTVTSTQKDPKLPAWVGKEITDDPTYQTAQLGLGN